MTVTNRVLRCTTHHNACDCREWHYQQALQALRIIQTWAACDSGSPHSRERAMMDIEAKCRDTLRALEVLNKQKDQGQ